LTDLINDATELQRRFGSNLRSIRSDMRLTQEELGERAGKQRVFIQRVEAGRANITIETMAALANAVSKPVEDLLKLDNTDTLRTGSTIGAHVEAAPGELAIELPESDAFSVARVAAAHLGKAIPLVDTTTRVVVGVAGPRGNRRVTSQPD
jgi:transcriptional regulator with XRE-family HTH domain